MGGEESKRERHEQTLTRRLVTIIKVTMNTFFFWVKVTMNLRKANQEEEVGEMGFLLVCTAAQKEESITYRKQKNRASPYMCDVAESSVSIG